MKSKHFCSACGHIDTVLEPITRDGFYVDPRFGLAKGEISLPLNNIERRVVHALAWSDHAISAATLTVIADSDAEEKTMQSLIGKVRTRMKKLGLICPIIPVFKEGYQWVDPDRAAAYGKPMGWFGSDAHRASISKGA